MYLRKDIKKCHRTQLLENFFKSLDLNLQIRTVKSAQILGKDLPVLVIQTKVFGVNEFLPVLHNMLLPRENLRDPLESLLENAYKITSEKIGDLEVIFWDCD